MSGLVTRCPACGTAYRVQPAQLAARAGQVRCGKCGHVFDGIEGLVEAHHETLLVEPSPQLGLFDPSRQAAPRPEPQDEPLPEFMADNESPRRSALWASLAAIAALVLAAQIIYFFRAEIAALVPAARAPLIAACRAAGCEVSLPRQLKLLSIDSYEVRADPRHDGVIVLSAVIRNRAPFPQEYPALQFALIDESNGNVASRILPPKDYLDPARAAGLMRRGIDANGEASFTVHFDASRARATGYRLELFYPS